MSSCRNYWSTGQLLDDWRYWRKSEPKYMQERAHASFRALMKKWRVPSDTPIDEHVRHQIERNNYNRPTQHTERRMP